MPFVFGYTRISTDEVKQVYSLDGQAEAIELGYQSRAALPNHAFHSPSLKLIKPFFRDMASAWKKRFRDRQAGSELFRRAQRGDHIIVAMSDRAFRSMEDMLLTMKDFEARGITLHILNLNIDPTDPIGKLILQVITALAEWESAVKSARLRQAHVAKKYVRGIATREPPMGWKWIKRAASRTTEPVPDVYERRLGNFCLGLDLAGATTEEIIAECKKLGKGKSKARQAATRDPGHLPYNAEYMRTLVKAALWGYPLPEGAETGYIKLPKVSDMGLIECVPEEAQPESR